MPHSLLQYDTLPCNRLHRSYIYWLWMQNVCCVISTLLNGKALRIETISNQRLLCGIWYTHTQQNTHTPHENIHSFLNIYIDIHVSQFKNHFTKWQNVSYNMYNKYTTKTKYGSLSAWETLMLGCMSYILEIYRIVILTQLMP